MHSAFRKHLATSTQKKKALMFLLLVFFTALRQPVKKTGLSHTYRAEGVRGKINGWIAVRGPKGEVNTLCCTLYFRNVAKSLQRVNSLLQIQSCRSVFRRSGPYTSK